MALGDFEEHRAFLELDNHQSQGKLVLAHTALLAEEEPILLEDKVSDEAFAEQEEFVLEIVVDMAAEVLDLHFSINLLLG